MRACQSHLCWRLQIELQGMVSHPLPTDNVHQNTSYSSGRHTLTEIDILLAKVWVAELSGNGVMLLWPW